MLQILGRIPASHFDISPETIYRDSGPLSCCSYFTGTLYHPYEPILLPSIGNAFVLRCLDGIHVDGNDQRMSKVIYKYVYSHITSAFFACIISF